jgi:hypothetical protein
VSKLDFYNTSIKGILYICSVNKPCFHKFKFKCLKRVNIYIIIGTIYTKIPMRENRYRKRKEVYEADIDMVKALLKLAFRNRKPPRQNGGYYIAVFKNLETA